MDARDHQRYGEELHHALVTQTVVEPLTSRERFLTIDDAYEIQRHVVGRRTAGGAHIIGKKIGVTSQVVMQMLNVSQPDFGQLTSDMAFSEGEAIALDTLIQPKAEAEIAFVLRSDLAGPGVTGADVLRATECVIPCFEIVDSRIRDWKIKIEDTIADNASCGVFLIGDRAVDPRRIDLALVGMVLEKNGAIVCTSAGAAALGSPMNAVAWLANALSRYGISLCAGEVILSGSLSPLVPIVAGDSMRASIGGVGSASVRFVDSLSSPRGHSHAA